MVRFTGKQRAFCVKQYYLNNGSIVTVQHLFRMDYRLNTIKECPSKIMIMKWVRDFEETGST